MRALLVAFILTASGASAAAPGEQQLAAYLEEHGKSPEDYVISKFADHQIVFLGEYHRIRHDVELVQKLVPRLYKAGIHNLGIEFGAEELQTEADRLVTADVYDPILARSLMFRWEPSWGYHEYIELYHAAWDVNRSRPRGAAPFRIVNLGYRVDFSQLQGERTPEVMRKVFARGDTDVFMADVIRREFLDKGEKALIYSGSHHAFTRYRQPIYNPDTKQVVRRMDDRMGNLVYQRAPDKVFTILLHYPVDSLSQPSKMIRPGNGMIDRVMETRFAGRSFGFDIAGSPFGDLPDPDSYYSGRDAGFTLKEWCDGYIYTKPLREYAGVTVEPDFITEVNLREAVAQIANPEVRPKVTSAKLYMEALADDTNFHERFLRVVPPLEPAK
jgi:hypothetical protein